MVFDFAADRIHLAVGSWQLSMARFMSLATFCAGAFVTGLLWLILGFQSLTAVALLITVLVSGTYLMKSFLIKARIKVQTEALRRL